MDIEHTVPGIRLSAPLSVPAIYEGTFLVALTRFSQ